MQNKKSVSLAIQQDPFYPRPLGLKTMSVTLRRRGPAGSLWEFRLGFWTIAQAVIGFLLSGNVKLCILFYSMCQWDRVILKLGLSRCCPILWETNKQRRELKSVNWALFRESASWEDITILKDPCCVSSLAVNIGSGLRPSSSITSADVMTPDKCDLWLIMAGYSPSLWGSQGRILKQLVTLSMKSRDKCMLAYHSAVFLYSYSPASQTRARCCLLSGWGSSHHLTSRITPYWHASWSTWLDNSSLRISSQVILGRFKLTILNTNHHGKSFQSSVFSLWSCLTILLRFMLMVPFSHTNTIFLCKWQIPRLLSLEFPLKNHTYQR